MRTLLLLAALVLAGCSSPEEPAAPAAVEPEPEAPVAEHVVASYEMLLTSVRTPANTYNMGGQNCLMLDDRGTITGTATVTWMPEPGMPEMELVLTGRDDLKFRTGDGEIVLEFQDFEAGSGQAGGSMLAWQASQGALAGAFVEKTGTLALDLQFVPEESDGEFDPEEGWTCSVGH